MAWISTTLSWWGVKFKISRQILANLFLLLLLWYLWDSIFFIKLTLCRCRLLFLFWALDFHWFFGGRSFRDRSSPRSSRLGNWLQRCGASFLALFGFRLFFFFPLLLCCSFLNLYSHINAPMKTKKITELSSKQLFHFVEITKWGINANLGTFPEVSSWYHIATTDSLKEQSSLLLLSSKPPCGHFTPNPELESIDGPLATHE